MIFCHVNRRREGPKRTLEVVKRDLMIDYISDALVFNCAHVVFTCGGSIYLSGGHVFDSLYVQNSFGLAAATHHERG